MGKKYRNLINQIIDPENIRRAYNQAATGRKNSVGYLQFNDHAQANLEKLRYEIADGSYQPGAHHHFMVYEPKPRQISALPFRDRVTQHALVNVIGPLFERTFLPMSYACRKNKGTHRGARRAQAIMRRMEKQGPVYCLKMDFSKYFASVDLSILHQQIRKKISCARTLALIESFTPTTGKGLPIGNLTSQLYANIYGTIFDRFLLQTLKIKNAVRYMDDTIIFHHSSKALQTIRDFTEQFINWTMKLQFSHWSIQSIGRGVNFLGYRIWATHKLIRKDSTKRAKKKLQKLYGEQRNQFLAAWHGHTMHANTYNLNRKLGVTT